MNDSGRSSGVVNVAFLWPALAAVSTREAAAFLARQFVDLALGSEIRPTTDAPGWTTTNRIALELRTVLLRDFSLGQDGIATLVCAPLALHGAVIADLAPAHSLVEALLKGNVSRLFVTDWRSAQDDMRFISIDDYLADLNVLVDHLGGRVNIIGLCQGGWMGLVYAARFPGKVAKLVLVGAPVDISAGHSTLSALAAASPLPVFQELVQLGDGRMLGHRALNFWGPMRIESDELRDLLQATEPIDSLEFAKLESKFRSWYAWTLDLPGTYYLEVVEKLYGRNELATGRLVALGKQIDLKAVQAPMFLLAAHNDEVVAPAQLFAAQRLVGTSAHLLKKETAPCGHLGLFMAKTILRQFWPQIASWLVKSDGAVGEHV